MWQIAQEQDQRKLRLWRQEQTEEQRCKQLRQEQARRDELQIQRQRAAREAQAAVPRQRHGVARTAPFTPPSTDRQGRGLARQDASPRGAAAAVEEEEKERLDLLLSTMSRGPHDPLQCSDLQLTPQRQQQQQPAQRQRQRRRRRQQPQSQSQQQQHEQQRKQARQQRLLQRLETPGQKCPEKEFDRLAKQWAAERELAAERDHQALLEDLARDGDGLCESLSVGNERRQNMGSAVRRQRGGHMRELPGAVRSPRIPLMGTARMHARKHTHMHTTSTTTTTAAPPRPAHRGREREATEHGQRQLAAEGSSRAGAFWHSPLPPHSAY